MITISPFNNAFVPVDSVSAAKVSGPNYDEFQNDTEIWQLIQEKPNSILKVTMPHCDVGNKAEIMVEGSAEALVKAKNNIHQLINNGLFKRIGTMCYIDEISNPKRPLVRQIGLGCLGKTGEIRTAENPNGSIIRNEGIREKKAKGRAELIAATQAFCESVNIGIDDQGDRVATALEQYADSRPCDYEAADQKGNRHKIWVITNQEKINELASLMAIVSEAYVADGNHRSAAAIMLGKADFPAVFFPVSRMRIDSYHRLIKSLVLAKEAFLEKLSVDFVITKLEGTETYQPPQIHQIGLYLNGYWYLLTPKPGTFNPADAVESIDADIVQKLIFSKILGIDDARDENFSYVGGDRGAEYLKEEVDRGDFEAALSLAPVTMEQFVELCKQNKYMPPKSTWFEPKLRGGLVIELLGDQ